jgi:hypothetical protein
MTLAFAGWRPHSPRALRGPLLLPVVASVIPQRIVPFAYSDRR